MLKETNKDLGEVVELEAFAKTSAGIIVIKGLKKEVNNMMFRFVAELQNPTLQKYIALSCELNEKLNLIKKLEGAGDIREIIEKAIASEEVVE